MEFKTPTDGLIKNGELYGIRDAYSTMINESFANTRKNQLFARIYESVKADGYERITKFAKKNTSLATVAAKKAVAKARKSMECSCGKCACSKEELDEACKKVIDLITSEFPKPKKLFVKKPHGNVGKLKAVKLVTINEADYDDGDTEDDEADVPRDTMRYEEPPKAGFGPGDEKLSPEVLGEINRLTKDIKYDRELPEEFDDDNAIDDVASDDDNAIEDAPYDNSDDSTASDVSSSDDIPVTDGRSRMGRLSDEFDDDADYSDDDGESRKVFDYCVQSIKLMMTANDRQLGETVTVHFVTPDDFNFKVQGLNDMEQVVDYINKVSGFYFDIDDYSCNFARAAKTGQSPMLVAKKVLTSDAVQGSKEFNKYFGPNGKYADYLYNADGTAKFSPDSEEAKNATDVEKDVSVVSSYPMIWVGARVFSRNHKTQKERPIKPLDFRGTAVVVKECTEANENTVTEGSVASALLAGTGHIVGGVAGGAIGAVGGPAGAIAGYKLGSIAGSAAGAALGARRGKKGAAALGAAVGGGTLGTLGAVGGAAVGGALADDDDDEADESTVNEANNTERAMMQQSAQQIMQLVQQTEQMAKQLAASAQQYAQICKNDVRAANDFNPVFAKIRQCSSSATGMTQLFSQYFQKTFS